MGFASHHQGGRPERPGLAAIVIGIMVCAATTSCVSGPAGRSNGSSNSTGPGISSASGNSKRLK